jgi:F0F1-type ATP synthase membrane subunit a
VGARVKGVILLIGLIAFAGLCTWITFGVMPGNGIAVALPVIQVPGEVVTYGGFFGMDLTNTIIGTLLTDLVLIVIAVVLWRVSRGWTKEVPGRFQGAFEAFITAFRNFVDGIGGEKFRKTPSLWYIVATIFLFLLVANYLKLLPGVETVGKLHCTYAGQNGFAMVRNGNGLYQLYVDESLNAGTTQTEETYAACNEYFQYQTIPTDGFAVETAEEIARKEEVFSAILGQLPATEDESALAAAYTTLVNENIATAADNPESVVAGRTDVIAGTDYATAVNYVRYAEDRIANAEAIESLKAEITRLQTLSDVDDEIKTAQEALNAAQTQLRYPGATLVFDEDQLATNARPYIFHITPFVRGAATDLNLTIGLAIIAVLAVQAYGVRALGPAYFEKFINLTAMGNVSKRPLGAIDFIVGLIEIISEIGKIVSLAFRLFGNLFAGGVALMALTFIFALFVPGVIMALELIIGAVQALVFAVLTLVFSVQAMESHAHHDDEHHEAH